MTNCDTGVVVFQEQHYCIGYLKLQNIAFNILKMLHTKIDEVIVFKESEKSHTVFQIRKYYIQNQ